MIKHINPLPISEEMLGAYLEGNLSLEEANNVENLIVNNDELRTLMSEVMDYEIDEDVSFGQDFPNGFENFDLPEIKLNDTVPEGFNSLSFNTLFYDEMGFSHEFERSSDCTSYNVYKEFYEDLELKDLECTDGLNQEYSDDGTIGSDIQWDNWDEI